MKPREACVQRRTVAYQRPIATGYGVIHRREVLLISVADSEGRWGHGEAAPLPGFSRDTLNDAEAALHSWVGGDNGGLEASPTASAAVDSAKLDLASQAAGVPLHVHLDPSSPSSVPVAALVVGTHLDELESAAGLAVASGHRTLKLKVGSRPITEDRGRIQAVRDGSGSQAAIRLDANGAWGLDEAVELLGRLTPEDIELIEEPVSGGLVALEKVAAQTGIPIAADESATHPESFAEILRTGSVAVVVIKPSAIGGPAEATRRIAAARDAGLSVVVTSMLEGAVGVAAAAHLASATAALDPEPGLATSALLAEDIGPALPVADGRLWLPERPGLGTRPWTAS
ncbi:MAG: o-succinylbenzoate synthase [Actinomycetota bacterium]|nr:o-succinylbenzoate synthase [Actinomycetota bacterium]